MHAVRMVEAGGFAHVDPVPLGGDCPVVIQTMWKDRLSFSDLEGDAGRALVERTGRLKAMGCGLLRFAVPDMEAAEVLGELASMVSMPLVADIHFDYRIALRCLDFPVAKIRINPGNIGSRRRVEQVLSKAAGRKVPIRIGVNGGSLPVDLREKADQGLGAEALVEAAERELAIFGEFGFSAVLVSMKASSVGETLRANRLFVSRSRGPRPPLHVGVTEAGPLIAGTVRNTAALLNLLAEGIGDTVRVSLSDTMENEVIAAREILRAAADLAALKAAGDGGPEDPAHGAACDGPARCGAGPAERLRRPGVTIVSCPRCGRNSFDTLAFSALWLPRLYTLDRDITVAIMGCVVNGPGEARHADLGITGAADRVLVFRHGKVIRTVSPEDAGQAFGEELEKL